MATKRQEMDDPDSCWNKAADDEVVFVLKSSDATPPDAVEDWANRVERSIAGLPLGQVANTRAKIKEARAVAYDMRAQQMRRKMKVPD